MLPYYRQFFPYPDSGSGDQANTWQRDELPTIRPYWAYERPALNSSENSRGHMRKKNYFSKCQ
jgi:hypothetical protein